MAEQYAQNSVTKVSYTDFAAYPPFASKAAFMNELTDPDNSANTDLLGFIARLANTDTSDWSDPLATLTDITDWGRL